MPQTRASEFRGKAKRLLIRNAWGKKFFCLELSNHWRDVALMMKGFKIKRGKHHENGVPGSTGVFFWRIPVGRARWSQAGGPTAVEGVGA